MAALVFDSEPKTVQPTPFWCDLPKTTTSFCHPGRGFCPPAGDKFCFLKTPKGSLNSLSHWRTHSLTYNLRHVCVRENKQLFQETKRPQCRSDEDVESAGLVYTSWAMTSCAGPTPRTLFEPPNWRLCAGWLVGSSQSRPIGAVIRAGVCLQARILQPRFPKQMTHSKCGVTVRIWNANCKTSFHSKRLKRKRWRLAFQKPSELRYNCL